MDSRAIASNAQRDQNRIGCIDPMNAVNEYRSRGLDLTSMVLFLKRTELPLGGIVPSPGWFCDPMKAVRDSLFAALPWTQPSGCVHFRLLGKPNSNAVTNVGLGQRPIRLARTRRGPTWAKRGVGGRGTRGAPRPHAAPTLHAAQTPPYGFPSATCCSKANRRCSSSPFSRMRTPNSKTARAAPNRVAGGTAFS
jgi:hypothetical protein